MPREQKEIIIHRLQAFYEEERSETIGELAAEHIMDWMIQELGPFIYNQAIQDARNMIHEKMLQIEDELYTLEKPVR